MYELDANNEWGYSIRCDVTRENGESNFISFIYENKIFTEWGYPRYINGNAHEGAWINPSSYLSTSGTKKIAIEGHIWSNMCFNKIYNIEIMNANKEEGTTSITSNVPTKSPTKTSFNVPTNAPLKVRTNAPKASLVETPTTATSAPLKSPIIPTTAPVKPMTKNPTIVPTLASTSVPTKLLTDGPKKSATTSVLPMTTNPTNALTLTPTGTN